MINGKKGNWVDVPEYMRFAVTFAILVGIGIVLMNGLNDEVQSRAESTMPNESKTAMARLNTAYPTGMDYLFLFGSMIFFVTSIVFARLIPSKSAFTFIATILIIVFPFLAMMLENVWDGFKQQTLLNTAYSQMKIMPFMLDHLTFVVLFYSLIVGVSLYAKDE